MSDREKTFITAIGKIANKLSDSTMCYLLGYAQSKADDNDVERYEFTRDHLHSVSTAGCRVR